MLGIEHRIVHGLILTYLLGIGLVYVSTVVLLGNVEGLRALHLDIPTWASDTVFQVKALVNLSAGVIMLIGCAGLVLRRQWGTPVTVIGLVWQVMIYVAELVLFQHLPTLGATVVVILLDTAVVYHLVRSSPWDPKVRDRSIG